MFRLVSGRLPDVAEVAPWVPPPLASTCNRATAFERKQRYRSVGQLAGDVRSWLDLGAEAASVASSDGPPMSTPTRSPAVEPWYRRLGRLFSR